MDNEKYLALQNLINKDLNKMWKKRLLSPFVKAISSYELIKEGDRIAVCMSGGKDSTLMAKLFQEIKRHGKIDFKLTFLLMDPGYSEKNLNLIKENAGKLGVPVTIFKTDIFDIVYQETRSPCYLCARMRRGYLYAKAQKLGCNKIALGHHYDDVIETILMGLIYGGQIQTMMPKLHSTNFEGMELIRPMYLVREDDIKRWRDTYGLDFLSCACHFTEKTQTEVKGDYSTFASELKLSESKEKVPGFIPGNISKRQETKLLIARLKQTNPDVKAHIFKSVENVNLDTVIAYKSKGERHHFLETYDEAIKE